MWVIISPVAVLMPWLGDEKRRPGMWEAGVNPARYRHCVDRELYLRSQARLPSGVRNGYRSDLLRDPIGFSKLHYVAKTGCVRRSVSNGRCTQLFSLRRLWKCYMA